MLFFTCAHGSRRVPSAAAGSTRTQQPDLILLDFTHSRPTPPGAGRFGVFLGQSEGVACFLVPQSIYAAEFVGVERDKFQGKTRKEL